MSDPPQLTEFDLIIKTSRFPESLDFYTSVLGGELETITREGCRIDWYGHRIQIHNHDRQEPLADGQAQFNILLKRAEFEEIRSRLGVVRTPFLKALTIENPGQTHEMAELSVEDPNGIRVTIAGFGQVE